MSATASNFRSLLVRDQPLLMPGAHDALSARMIEAAGFSAYGVGGAALSATQLAQPDIGVQSFGEYRDAVARIMEGSRLPVMIDGENGFGDLNALKRTVQSFERMGVAGIAFEDLGFPPVPGAAPSVIAHEEMIRKLTAALAARRNERLFIIGRTDAAYTLGLTEALARARAYQDLGIDAVLVPGLADLAAYQQLRDAIRIPIFAVVVPESPWFAPTVPQLTRVGIEAAIYPAAILTRMVLAIGAGLDAIRATNGAPPTGFDRTTLARLLNRVDD
jgi:2-methylisocitrate lyase-like PEP mutase family enzyme